MITPVCENNIWSKSEILPREELKALQLIRLKNMVARVSQVPFYRDYFKKNNLTSDSINSLDDLHKLPFTTKADLRDHYPLGFVAVPPEQIVRYHGSSGTTGKPTFVAYTKNDLNLWSSLCARFLTAGGLTPNHIVQVAFGYGLFTGGFGLHYGIEKVGAAVIPAASGNTAKQLVLMRDLQTDVLISTPSYALRIAEYIDQAGIDRNSLALKFAHLGGEPWTEDMRVRIEDDLKIKAFNNYGLSEVLGPGISGECAFRQGMHVQEDHFIVECIDPNTLEPVAPGEEGELVFTALTKEAFPIIRYRTRDMAKLILEPCPCGRTGIRMSRVIGRSDDMLIVRGVNVYPSQIEEAILQVKGTAPHYRITVSRPGVSDEMEVEVEIDQDVFSDRMSSMQNLHKRLVREIQSITGLMVEVKLVQPNTLERFSGKAKRVIDTRKL